MRDDPATELFLAMTMAYVELSKLLIQGGAISQPELLNRLANIEKLMADRGTLTAAQWLKEVGVTIAAGAPENG